jgi:hypothetical protein
MNVPALAVITLASWLLTASIGGFMFGTWLARGGLRQRRVTGTGPPPGVIFGHAGLAVTGLAVWAAYVATAWPALAWAAVGLLMPVIGLGISTVTLWTPYPVAGGGAARGPAGAGSTVEGVLAAPAPDVLTRRITDEMLARALTDPELASNLTDMVVASLAGQPAPARRRSRRHLAPLIPAGHGAAAVATFLLAVLTAAGAR